MFERMRTARPGPFQFSWWQERMLHVLMLDEWLKVQAFRFIDVLPTMSDDIELARHLREYFVLPQHARGGSRDNGAHEPQWFAAGRHGGWPRGDEAVDRGSSTHELENGPLGRDLVRLVSHAMNFRRLDGVLARLFSLVARRSASLMAGSFIAGSTLDEAERSIRRMRDQRMAFTIDVLGEAAVSASEAEAYHATYMDLVRQLPGRAARWSPVPLIDEADGRPIPRVNVSTKLTSLYPGFDPIAWDACKSRAKDILRPIVREAVKGGAHIHLDMEHYAIKDLTLDAWEELFMEPEFRDYPHVGIVLQAYLKDGDKDVCRIIDYAKRRGTSIWVRLVKGAYWDSETVWAAQRHWPVPVWEQKWQSDACYERMTRALLENYRHTHAAFASHNVRSLCHAIACREALAVPGWAFELQMLFGMGDPIKHAAIQMGQRCRVYTPYGNMLAGMAYLIRRLLENTANESFLRQSGDDDADIDKLLEHPLVTGEHTPPPAPPVVIRYEFEEPVMEPFENAANTDFGLHDARRRMQGALAAERAKMGRELPLVLGGEAATTGQWFETLNPSKPSEVVARVALADQAAVDRAVAAALRAYGPWRRVTPVERSAALERIADVLEARRFEFSALQSLEAGKTWREADADVSEAIDYCRYYAREMRRIAVHRRRRDIEGETNEHYYTPRGVTAVLSPFNFPLSLLVNMASAALVTGNTVVIKPASTAAATAARFVDVCREAELPAGAVNFVAGPGESVGELLVKHADVATIAFTGSRAAGLRINRLAAETLTRRPSIKRVVLELGAKNAIIVDADADLDEAIKGVLASAFSYAGQKCSAASRVILLDSVHDRFMERFVEAARSKGVGPADEPTTSIPPLVDKRQFDAIRAAIEAGKREAKCVLAVDTSDLVQSTGGYYVGPHVFDDVPAKSRLVQDEILGPVVCIQRASDFEQAVELFNGTDYALTGGLYSRSPAHIERAREACECGVLYINRPITGSRVDLQPFGGLKLSGGGPKIGGPDYLLQYCESRTVTENTLRRGFAPSEEVAEALA